jgi:hypothetical protein
MKLLVAASAALALATTAAPKPAAPIAAPGTLARTAVPGGWLLVVAGDPGHLLVEVAGYAPRSGRTLLVTAATSSDYAKLLATTATLLDADGKVVRAEPLRGYHAITGDLSPAGTLGAVLAEPYEEGGNRAVLIGLDDAGTAIWKRPATPGDEIVVSDRWIAEVTPPKPPAALDDLDNDPPSPAPATEKMPPARFFARNGDPIQPPAPVPGVVVRAGDGLVSVSGSKVHLYASNLAERAQAALPFAAGFPAASADGSLIAVADFTVEEKKTEHTVLLFDGSAKKTGSITIPSPVGVDVAIAPDGSALLVTSATTGVGGPATSLQPGEELVVEAVDRTGKVRWKYATKKRTEMEHAGSMSLSAGGKRAACGFFAGDPASHPDRAVIFDAAGKTIYTSEGSFKAVWLDPTGEWLYTVEDVAVSRLRVKDLLAGTAFPKP